jgi:hypothetical protein
MDTYNAVEQATKHKLERVLATWKSGPTGNPVYSSEVTGPIEKTLMKQQMRYQSRGSIDGGRTHIHINPNFLSGINSSGLASYQQSQQLQPTTQPTQQVQQVQQPIQQTSNTWVDTTRYNNGTSAFSTAAPTRQGFYNTTQVSLLLNLYHLFFAYDFLLFLLSYIRVVLLLSAIRTLSLLLHYKTVCFLSL